MTVFLRSTPGDILMNAKRISLISILPEYDSGKLSGRVGVTATGKSEHEQVSAGLFESRALGAEFALRLATSLVDMERAGGGIVNIAFELERFETANADLRQSYENALR